MHARNRTFIAVMAGALGAAVLMPVGGAVAKEVQEVFVTNTVDVSGSEVAIAGTPERWDDLAVVPFSQGAAFGSVTIEAPEDATITIERISAGDHFNNPIASLDVFELCDFTDGKNGFGGAANVPVGPTGTPGRQGLDHTTSLTITPGACIIVNIELETALAPNVSGSTTVTLSGTILPVPAEASAAALRRSTSDALLRSLDDPALAGVLTPGALEAVRASASRD